MISRALRAIDSESFLSLHSCVLHLSDLTSFPSHTVALSSRLNKTVVLSISFSEDVEPSVIVVHQWVLEALGVENQSNVQISATQLTKNKICSIVLLFCSARKNCSWDDTSIGDFTFDTFKWCYHWPTDIDENLIEKFCHMVLKDNFVIKGSRVILKFLGFLLIFEVVLIKLEENLFISEQEVIPLNNCQCFHVQKSSNTLKSTENSLKIDHITECTFSQDLIREVTTILKVDSIRFSVKSVLLSGSEGSGKSELLKYFHSYLEKENEYPLVFQLNCKRVQNKEYVMKDISEAQSSGSIKQCLDKILSFFNISIPNLDLIDDPVRAPKVFLLLDNLDEVFEICMEESMEKLESTEDQYSINLRIFGFLLRDLISRLSFSTEENQNNEKIKVFIIGTTRLSLALLPKSHMGSPEFEYLFQISRPTKTDRMNIITRFLVSNFIDSSNNAEIAMKLSGLTAGYLPGDLQNLLRKGKLLLEGNEGKKGLYESFIDALLIVHPKQLQKLSLLSDFNSKSSNLTWDDFAGYDDIKYKLKRLLTTSGKTISAVPNNFFRFLPSPRGILLHGPTGCGKTFLARIIAVEGKMNFVSIRSTEVLSKYFGQTEKKIRELFTRARAAAPSVLFFDEFDVLAHKRSGGSDDSSSGLNGRILSTFLNELDGLLTNKSSHDPQKDHESRVIVLAACSDVSLIDEALLRPGRLYHQIYLNMPTPLDIRKIISRQLEILPLTLFDPTGADEVTNILTKKIEKTGEFSSADIEAICKNAKLLALKDNINMMESEMRNGSFEHKLLKLRHFEESLKMHMN